jgi:lipopolysaccharide export LptBFGC system permease protein LptF
MTSGTSPTTGSRRIKQGKTSLIGGIAVGVAVLVLWVAIVHELAMDGLLAILIGLLVSSAVAAWIRLADL